MEIHPCVLQDIGPLGFAALLSPYFFSYLSKQGIGYRWPCAILGWLVLNGSVRTNDSLWIPLSFLHCQGCCRSVKKRGTLEQLILKSVKAAASHQCNNIVNLQRSSAPRLLPPKGTMTSTTTLLYWLCRSLSQWIPQINLVVYKDKLEKWNRCFAGGFSSPNAFLTNRFTKWPTNGHN